MDENVASAATLDDHLHCLAEHLKKPDAKRVLVDGETWSVNFGDREAMHAIAERISTDPEGNAFERGRAAGKYEAALETSYGSFSGHVQSVFTEARRICDALAGDKAVDALGAALNAHDDFLRSHGQNSSERQS